MVFFGVPAEEYVEIEKRNEMREQGLIRYGCGKCELLRIGALDDVDIVVGHHSSCEKKYLVANRSCNLYRILVEGGACGGAPAAHVPEGSFLRKRTFRRSARHGS